MQISHVETGLESFRLFQIVKYLQKTIVFHDGDNHLMWRREAHASLTMTVEKVSVEFDAISPSSKTTFVSPSTAILA